MSQRLEAFQKSTSVILDSPPPLLHHLMALILTNGHRLVYGVVTILVGMIMMIVPNLEAHHH